MIKKLISTLCVLTAAVSMIPSAGALQGSEPLYKELIRFNFDSVNDGKLSSYSENGVSIYIDNKETAYISGEAAPAGKIANTSLSDGDTDKVIAFNLGNKSQNPNIRLSFSNASFKGKVKLAYSYYVPQCTNASYGLFNSDIRNNGDSQSYNVLMSLRGNKNFQYCPTVNTSTNNGKFSTGTWYRAELIIDADTRTYDFSVNGVLKGEDCKLNSSTVFNEIRFSTNNTSQNLSNTYVYLDDVYMGVETQRPTPVFDATVHESGTDNTDATNAPKDMNGIKVKFPFDMEPESFEGNVTLKRGNDKNVSFTGEYNSTDKTYTAYLGEKAIPCTEYTLTFGGDVKTASTQTDGRYSDIYLTTPEAIKVTTEKVDFAVSDIYFTSDASGNDVISEVDAQAQKIYGNVDVVSSELLEGDKNVTVFVLCYQDGMMENVFMEPATIQPPTTISNQTISVEADISEITVNENTHFELIVWDQYMTMLPLFGGSQISGK